jgi:hypothetical protein
LRILRRRNMILGLVFRDLLYRAILYFNQTQIQPAFKD